MIRSWLEVYVNRKDIEMPVIMRATVALQPGCRLRYCCPSQGDSWEATEFFRKYQGKPAQFVSYGTTLVGVLNYYGRKTGVYINPEYISVRFDGEEKVWHNLNIQHFVVIDPTHATLTGEVADLKAQRVGDLLHPILFYPDDIVRLLVKPPEEDLSDDPRLVREVFLNPPFVTHGGLPRYSILETPQESERRMGEIRRRNEKLPIGKRILMASVPKVWSRNTVGDELELVARGNVWALYNDPAQLSFPSDEEELQFWTRSGIARPVYNLDGCTLQEAWYAFYSGTADVISISSPGFHSKPSTYAVHTLLGCWAAHREHVRALTTRLWSEAVTKESAA